MNASCEPLPDLSLQGYQDRLDSLKRHIFPAESVLILTHDYPDPDCLASALGMAHLLKHWSVKSTVISFGGFVGRAENRAMIRYLNIPTVPFMLIEMHDFDRIIVVDVMPGGGNCSLPQQTTVHAVIDHHLALPRTEDLFFHDVRQDIGATSTIITKYLAAANCPIPQKLATALFYGIKTDTNDMERVASTEDLECYRYLFDRIDNKLLGKIENPDRDLEFFRILHRTAESAVSYNAIGYAHMDKVSAPDYIAEMTDLFHSLEKLEWMICSGVFKKNIFFSIRSKNENEAGHHADRIAKMLGGSGGGHGRAGAGKIPLNSEQGDNPQAFFEKALKEVFNISEIHGTHLILQ